MSEQPLPAPVAALLVTSQSWLRRKLLFLALGLGLLVWLSLSVYSYYAGQASELQQQAGVALKVRQVQQLQRDAQALAAAQALSQHRADSAYAKSKAPERDAARRRPLIDSLTKAYHAQSTDTARPAAAADYLRHYHPGPDAAL